jgi:hypothetical protein
MTEARLLSILREHVAQKKTGVMEITSARASANLRLVRGEVVFAEAGRAEGEKALFRALSLKDARSAFYERDVPTEKNIDTKTDELMAAATVVVDETSELLSLFSNDAPLVAVDPGAPPTVNLAKPRVVEELSPAVRSLLHLLRSPIKLEDLLDADPGSDHEILIGLARLEKAGRLKMLASPKSKTAVARGDDLTRIERAIDAHPTSMRTSRPRLILAGAPHRLALVAHAITCFEGANPPAENNVGAPAVPMPHVVARWTAHRIDLDLVVCPLVPAYSPLWPMAVAGAHAALRLDSAARDLFDRACAAASVKIVDASALAPSYDDTNVDDIAALVRGALLA